LWGYEVWDGAGSGEEWDSEYGWSDDCWIKGGLNLEFLVRGWRILLQMAPDLHIAGRPDMGRELEGPE
jgi:hypothetical protein